MPDKFTERYSPIFTKLHPLFQSNLNDMVSNFRQINLAILGIDGSFITNDVIQITLTESVIFQIVLGQQNIVFDLYEVGNPD